MIELREFRALLGDEAKGKNDAEVLQIRDDMYGLMGVIVRTAVATNFQMPIERRSLGPDIKAV